MDILELNKKAWDNIGSKANTKYIKNNKGKVMLDLFCNKLKKGAKILDLGCGPGIPITKYLVDRGFNVTGIDLSNKMIELARKNVSKATYINCSMTDINFKNEFDGVISNYTMLCLDPPKFELTADKITKSLKKGGYFLISLNEPDKDHDDEENITTVMGQKMYSRPYSEKEIKNYFDKLKIVKIEREIIQSKNYGKENCLIILMQK